MSEITEVAKEIAYEVNTRMWEARKEHGFTKEEEVECLRLVLNYIDPRKTTKNPDDITLHIIDSLWREAKGMTNDKEVVNKKEATKETSFAEPKRTLSISASPFDEDGVATIEREIREARNNPEDKERLIELYGEDFLKAYQVLTLQKMKVLSVITTGDTKLELSKWLSLHSFMMGLKYTPIKDIYHNLRNDGMTGSISLAHKDLLNHSKHGLLSIKVDNGKEPLLTYNLILVDGVIKKYKLGEDGY